MWDSRSLCINEGGLDVANGDQPICLTGSPAHKARIGDIASKLQRLGFQVNYDPPHTFKRWDVDCDGVSLSIEGVGRVDVSSAFPYSGKTSATGVTAPLRLVHPVRKNWSNAGNAIAVIEVLDTSLPFDLVFTPWENLPAESVRRPIISAYAFTPDLDKAREAGVLGVICLWGPKVSSKIAAGQYLPFWQDYHDLPAVWVSGDVREKVLQAAKDGRDATLVLNAARTKGDTQTIWVSCDGETDAETVLVITHTDGTNEIEENGYLALLDMAAKAKSRKNRRKFIYVFVTGHFRIPAVSVKQNIKMRMPLLPKRKEATDAWLKAHPELWDGKDGHARAAAGLVIEHLGALEVDGDGTPTGLIEPEIVYATTAQLFQKAKATWHERSAGRRHFVAPHPLIHLGEGEPLYQNDIPAIALVPGPQYLVVLGSDKLTDDRLLEAQLLTFDRLQTELDGMSGEEIGRIRKPSAIKKVWTILRFIKAYLDAILGRT